MNAELRQSKEPVSAWLAGPYGHPLHPLLVTVPIGAWLGSLVFDVASRVVSQPGFLSQGSEWLIAIGVLGAMAAATIGFLDLMLIPPGTRAFRTAITHMWLNLAITAAYAANFWWRHGSYGHGPVRLGMLALSAASMAALGLSGFLGGKLAYRYGVRVADETTQLEGFTAAGAPGAAAPGAAPPAAADAWPGEAD
ncbi:MAG: DUF2231 domain-containing protein [Actinomycetota bacterium]